MCSIVGATSRQEALDMLFLLNHRAPDGQGVFDDQLTVIGMGRLAIIDLKSDVPCPFEKDGLVLAFNGEIYNYLDLRKELKKLGHYFFTNTDSEVLLEAYREWGTKMFDRLNGMFAFAIYDGEKIVLARDIAGEKPLYYQERPFRFASEVKALDFDGIEFPPAHYAVYDFRNLVIKPYWEFKPREINLKTAVDELESLLEDSVKLRTQSDVPYGLYFSGGIDSTLISTFHDFKHKFTYDNCDYKDEFLKVFPKILYHLDYPTNHFSVFALWKLAEQAKAAGVKVILSGEGADELFGGYVRYVKPHFSFLARKEFPSYHGMFPEAEDVTSAGLREFSGNMQELLRMGDRMTSAFGIENRCPVLDKRIIEFAFSLPFNLKIDGLQTKVILQKLLKRRKPDYKFFEKTGLFCPVNSWIGEPDPYRKEKYLKYQEQLWKKLS